MTFSYFFLVYNSLSTRFIIYIPKAKERNGLITRLIPSLVASARISAQETVALQAASTLALIVSITSKPLAEF